MSRIVHFDMVPCPSPPAPTDIVLACGHDWTDGCDISTDPDDTTCAACLRTPAMAAWRQGRAVHWDIAPMPQDGPAWTGAVELACGRPAIDQCGLSYDQRRTSMDPDDVTCPDCSWIIRRDRADRTLLPPHYMCRMPIDVGELARAIKRIGRPGWTVDYRLGHTALIASAPEDRDQLFDYYRRAIQAEEHERDTHATPCE